MTEVWRSRRWGTEAQGTHCREGDAGHNVLLGGQMRDTQRSQIISTKLQQIAEQAKCYPDRVFTSLCHYMDLDFLEEAYWRLKHSSAPGLSGTTFKGYGKQLTENLQELHERLKTGRYDASPIKRVWIDKDKCRAQN